MTSVIQGAFAPGDSIAHARTALQSAAQLTDQSQKSLDSLAALFLAIQRETPGTSHAHRLASIGQYLADDWANLHDCEREDLEQLIEKFTAMLAPEAPQPPQGEPHRRARHV